MGRNGSLDGENTSQRDVSRLDCHTHFSLGASLCCLDNNIIYVIKTGEVIGELYESNSVNLNGTYKVLPVTMFN